MPDTAEPHRLETRPRAGDTVRDSATGLIGVFMALEDGKAFLRPLGGGREWETGPEHLEPLTVEEELSAKVQAANRQTRRRP
jgi:hypothetical protein